MAFEAPITIKEIIDVGTKKIGITHGSGGPQGIEERIRTMFDQVNIIIYGHSHQSQNEIIEDILFFNPGKAANSFGILTIGEEVKGEIISSRY